MRICAASYNQENWFDHPFLTRECFSQAELEYRVDVLISELEEIKKQARQKYAAFLKKLERE